MLEMVAEFSRPPVPSITTASPTLCLWTLGVTVPEWKMQIHKNILYLLSFVLN
jgi:hypothetical protein